ncbi:hypothetical protein SEA_MOLLYMUR_69 [Gordonia phage Mollymur]|uniref:Uncharacterized protein n=1 Tax=Gordonia phage Mollymur TaxID=2590895 RepID=A0A4Y6EKS8_9CAUD|nr:hypothetical protein PQB84_gp057 [Gordonia phage Mollymur]QDF15429.1 hypothetical protein SEA_MOLLYMUR_69 [Gordonia phage Mollymur]
MIVQDAHGNQWESRIGQHLYRRASGPYDSALNIYELEALYGPLTVVPSSAEEILEQLREYSAEMNEIVDAEVVEEDLPEPYVSPKVHILSIAGGVIEAFSDGKAALRRANILGAERKSGVDITALEVY